MKIEVNKNAENKEPIKITIKVTIKLRILDKIIYEAKVEVFLYIKKFTAVPIKDGIISDSNVVKKLFKPGFSATIIGADLIIRSLEGNLIFKIFKNKEEIKNVDELANTNEKLREDIEKGIMLITLQQSVI